MNSHLISITRTKTSDDKPKISFYAEWLKPMGFVPDALVQFLPEENGCVFVLCNENISSYSELYQYTTAKGGTLINARLYSKFHKDHPCLGVSGKCLSRAGINFGDNLIAQYEYGRIRMRKLPSGNVKLVTHRIFGSWLNDFGFIPEAVLTVASNPGVITCTLQENGVERTHKLVKYAWKNKLNLTQVQTMRDNNHLPIFEIQPSRMEKAGFASTDLLLASCKYGLIQIRKLDFKALGF